MSATVTELRRHEQAGRRQRDADERAASLAKIEADAKAHRDARTLIPGPLRAEIRARAILRSEGRPCSFVPARIAEQVAALAEAAADSELADRFQAWAPLAEYTPTPAMTALVDVLRPFASEPIGMLTNVAGAVAHLDASGYGEERRQARAAAAELKRESRREKQRATAAARAAKPARAAAKPKAAPVVTPQPEPNEEESVPMTDETGAPPATPLDAAVLAHRANPCDETRSALMAEQEAHTDGFYRRVADECITQQAAPAPAPVVAPVVHAPAAPAPAATIPQPLADYLARLVNGAKLTYAAALVAHLFTGAERPEMPSADWAPKVLAKVEKYSGRKVGR